MALPKTLKTWLPAVSVSNSAHGNANENARDVVFRWKNAMIGLGAVVAGSSNGAAAGMDGIDRIAAYTDWLGNLGIPQVSWLVLTLPNGSQFCVRITGEGFPTDYATFSFSFSADGGFTGGSTSAFPSAPHETHFDGVTGPFGSTGGGHGAETYTARIISSDDGLCIRTMWFRATTIGIGYWGFDQAVSGKGMPSTWSGNYAMCDSIAVNAGRVGGLIDNFQNGFGAALIYTYANGHKLSGPDGDAPIYMMTFNKAGSSTPWDVFVSTVNGLTGLYDIMPVSIGNNQASPGAVRGIFAVVPDMYILPRLADSSGTPKFTSGSTAPLSGTRKWISHGDLLVGWDGATVVNGDVGDFDVLDFSVCDCPEPPGPPPLVDVSSSDVTDGPGRFGVDVNATLDVPLRWGLANGTRNLGNALVRRLSTPRGSMPDDPAYGEDIRDMLNGGFTPTQLGQIRSRISAECLKDERVQAIDVDFAWIQSSSLARIVLTVDTADGTFRFVVVANALTVELIDTQVQQ